MIEAEAKYSVNFNVEHKLQLTKFLFCLSFATEAHKDQRRKDCEQTPYINHPIGVAYILTEEADVTNLDLTCGCLLHDTVEDTPVTIEDIRATFGNYLGNLVHEVTDDKSLPKQERKDLQISHAKHSSPQAKMVKLADKLYNLRDLERGLPTGWTEERRQEYFRWAFKVCEGLRGVCPKLEEKLDEIFKRKGLVSQRKLPEGVPEILPWIHHDELKPLVAAANFAAQKHSRHFLFDDTGSVPYINHVVSVTHMCGEEGVEDTRVLCAALLYAVVGKADAMIEEVGLLFGEGVRQLVAEVTLDHSLPIEDQFRCLIETASSKSSYAKLIILAAAVDLCRRLRHSEPAGWPPPLKKNFLQWSGQLGRALVGSYPHLDQQLEHALG